MTDGKRPPHVCHRCAPPGRPARGSERDCQRAALAHRRHHREWRGRSGALFGQGAGPGLKERVRGWRRDLTKRSVCQVEPPAKHQGAGHANLEQRERGRPLCFATVNCLAAVNPSTVVRWLPGVRSGWRESMQVRPANGVGRWPLRTSSHPRQPADVGLAPRRRCASREVDCRPIRGWPVRALRPQSPLSSSARGCRRFPQGACRPGPCCADARARAPCRRQQAAQRVRGA